MKLKNTWLTRLKRRYAEFRCYTSIETLPILVWFKIHQTNDAGLLYKYFKGATVDIHKIWGEIYDEYINRIGLNKAYLDYVEKTMAIARLQILCIENPTPINKINLAITIQELKEKENQRSDEYTEIIAAVSKKTGFPVNKVSVLEFYSYLKINKQNA